MTKRNNTRDFTSLRGLGLELFERFHFFEDGGADHVVHVRDVLLEKLHERFRISGIAKLQELRFGRFGQAVKKGDRCFLQGVLRELIDDPILVFRRQASQRQILHDHRLDLVRIHVNSVYHLDPFRSSYSSPMVSFGLTSFKCGIVPRYSRTLKWFSVSSTLLSWPDQVQLSPKLAVCCCAPATRPKSLAVSGCEGSITLSKNSRTLTLRMGENS